MSEKLPEQNERAEHFEAKNNVEREPVHHLTSKEKHQEHDKAKIESLKHQAEHEAKSKKEVGVDSTVENKPKDSGLASRNLKTETLKRNLQRARAHLSRPDRALSKAVHQPVIDTISKIGEKTIARPNGILAGSIVALLGSSYVLYTAKHYGFTYNYSVVFILFGGGYVVGLILETIIFIFRRPNRR